jgi:hypothetical protein
MTVPCPGRHCWRLFLAHDPSYRLRRPLPASGPSTNHGVTGSPPSLGALSASALDGSPLGGLDRSGVVIDSPKYLKLARKLQAGADLLTTRPLVRPPQTGVVAADPAPRATRLTIDRPLNVQRQGSGQKNSMNAKEWGNRRNGPWGASHDCPLPPFCC